MRPLLTLCALTSLLFVGCSPSGDSGEIRSEMQDAFKTTRDLYSYVWTPSRFSNPSNRTEILALLDRLLRDFHRVEKDAPAAYVDPGFEVSLQVNREILVDARARLADGESDYAGWRLKGLLDSCISCHTRYQVPVDFRGEAPDVRLQDTFASRFGLAEFHVASRQFDRASRLLIALAQGEAKIPNSSENVLRALKLWLVVQLRVKADPLVAAKTLGTLLKSERELSPDVRDILASWKSSLSRIPRQKAKATANEAARALLAPVWGSSSVGTDDAHLPTTLRATTILHPLLTAKDLPETTRRTATHLLGVAYSHVNIESLEVFRELYLEQCIREFPETKEARDCFLMLKSEVEFSSSGSSGLNLDDESRGKLNTLREIAYGADASGE